MKHIKGLLLLMFAVSCAFMLKSTSYAATNITYVDLESHAITINNGANNVTDPTTATAFTNLETAVTSDSTCSHYGKTPIAYIYEGCRAASKPNFFADGSYDDNYPVTVVFREDIAHDGTVGTGLWYITNDNKLIITAAPVNKGDMVTLADTSSAYGTTDVPKTFTGSKSAMWVPEMLYDYEDLTGETRASGVGVLDPETFDEKEFVDSEWYKFTPSAEETADVTLGARDSITMPSVRVDIYGTGTLNPKVGGVGWANYAATITDIYISDDIKLSENVNGLFNATGNYIKDTGDDSNDISDSIYAALKNVYLYCDMTEVTSCAGMFARCPELENVFIREGDADKDFQNVESTAYMFYGDKKLKNDAENSLVNKIKITSPDLESTAFMYGGCEAIVHPNVQDISMGNVKWGHGMFFGAKNAGLVSDTTTSGKYNIHGWDLSSLIDATAMFSGGDNDGEINLDYPLETMDPGLSEDIGDYGNVIVGQVDMGSWNMAHCKMMYMMFSRNGENFRELLFGDSYPELIDASGMCLRCDYLDAVSLYQTSMPLLKNTTLMFKLAGSKATVTAAADLNQWSAPVLENADMMFYGSGFRTVDTTGISNMANVESAMAMFGEMANLSSLGEGALDGTTFAALESAAFMFINDNRLPKVDTSDFNLSNVVSIDGMFYNTPELTAGVDVSGWNIGASLKSAQCFAYKNGMSSFDLSSWVSNLCENFAFAFSENENLASVTFSTATNSLYTAESICGMLSDCPKLVSVTKLPVATNCVDARGVFANDELLTTVDVSTLINNKTLYTAYFMKGCKAITALDVSGWNATKVTHTEGAFDGCNKLAAFTLGSGFQFNACKDAGTMFRDCYVLPSSQLSRILARFNSAADLEGIYEMLKNCYALVTLDMSEMELSSVTDYTRVACMDESDAYTTNKLVTIILPDTVLTATGVILDDGGSSINMFWVDGDGASDGDDEESSDEDDLLTTLYLLGTPKANILNYSFGGTNGDNDNRTFVKKNGRTINGADIGTYELADSTDTAAMKLDCTSTLYTGGTTTDTSTLSELAYSWTKDGSSIAGADEETYTTNKSGSYLASAYPAVLTAPNSKKSATFTIAASITGLKATYNGDPVTVGKDYSLDDVEVVLVDTDGNEYPLTASDYTVDSRKVTKVGDNTYTVTYDDGSGTPLTTTLKVPGVRHIGSITATYSGPSVLVGKEYDPEYVTVMAYYEDDTQKKEGFEVTPTELSSLKVTTTGDNNYTATYVDTTNGNKKFTAPYVVNGFKAITSIAATYTGDKIKVGNKYDKDDVKVTLYYSDGSGSTTTKNFTVDSQTVTYEGGNSFTASYRDPFGNVYTAGFSVPGYKDSDSSSSASSGNQASNASGTTTSTVVAPAQTYSASAVKQGKSSGVVQTGRTFKTTLYIVAFICIIGVVAFAIVQRKKQGKK